MYKEDGMMRTIKLLLVGLFLGLLAVPAQGQCLRIKKYVSVDSGMTWHDAETPPGPSTTVGSDVMFKVVVCNCGDVPLTEIRVSDPYFTFPGVATELAVGECDESDVVTVLAVEGQHRNEACVTAAEIFPAWTCNKAYYITGEGCTPDYWKDSPGCWECYDPEDDFGDTFGIPEQELRRNGKSTHPNPNLMQALNANGGGINALARHAVAALLNACDGDIAYPMTVSGIIAAVQEAVPDGDIEGLKDMLDMYNNYGCGQSSDDTASPCSPEDEPPV
jgi:hypothetical protein